MPPAHNPPASPHLPLGGPVLLIGWDAADWGVIDPLLKAGRMPHLGTLVTHGIRRTLIAPPPLLSPILWTSIGTGKRPDQHGVHGHAMAWRNGRGTSAAHSAARACASLWHIVSNASATHRANVVAWPVTYPAEPLNGVVVSERAPLRAAYGISAGEPHEADLAVHPPSLGLALAELCRQPRDIDSALLRRLIPRLDEIDPVQDRRLGTCRGVLAEAETITAVTEYVLATGEPWQLTAVHFPGLERLARLFMEYHPPRRAMVDESDAAVFGDVMASAYEHHDHLLGRLLRAAEGQVTVLLVSDHGFQHDERRPAWSPTAKRPSHEAMAVAWHRPEGIAVLSGPGVRQGELGPASIYDVTPTVLATLGLPVGQDMAGRAWVEAFAEGSTLPVTVIPSCEDAGGGATILRTRVRAGHDWRDPIERSSDDAVRHLVDLGYEEPVDPHSQREVEQVRYANALNLAQSFLSAQRHDQARHFVESCLQRWPGDVAMQQLLAMTMRLA